MSTPLLDKAFAKDTLLACEGYIPSFIDSNSPIHFKNVLAEITEDE